VTEAFRTIEDGLREELLREVGKSRWRLWFRDTAVRQVGEESVTLAVPTEVHRTWLEYTYAHQLRRAVRQVLGDGVEVRLEVSRAQGARREVREHLPERSRDWEALVERHRPRPTLEGFVGDGERRFAARLLASLAHGGGAEDPPSVFLYGDSGTGKTHLLRALEADALAVAPGDVLYLTAQRFTSRYVSALRAKELDAVRAFEVDLGHRRIVLLDDVHTLQGRTATQAALVRLRERTVGRGTRFVLTATRHPRDLEGLSPRLRSWLESGVVLRLPSPSRACLEEVLAARARTYGMGEAPEGVLRWILDHTGSVHGAVQIVDRWGAASVHLGRPLGADLVEDLVPDVAVTTRQEIVRRAKDAVAAYYKVPLRALEAATKAHRAALPRRVAIYLVYRAAALPLKDLARAFGLRSHSSASRAIQLVREERQRDPALENVIDGLLARM